jgi:3-hydroxybutyrate dehydrogenase
MPRPDREAGACDILVNNAGIQHVAAIPDFPVEKWDAIIAINLSSAFHTTAAALPMMRAAGWGRVINIASAHGLTASPYKSAYIAAKHGIVGLTKTTALETAEEPITANAICPGYVLTPLVEAQIPDTMKEYDMSREDVIRNVMLTRQPSKEFATVEQMGGTAVFLCSDAAAQITGTTISVDGAGRRCNSPEKGDHDMADEPEAGTDGSRSTTCISAAPDSRGSA